MYKLLKIIDHFGIGNQMIKLIEELNEVDDATHEIYDCENVSRETLMHLREELGDAVNVIDGILLKEYSITPFDSLKNQQYKIDRTCGIIDRAVATGKTYEEVRKNG